MNLHGCMFSNAYAAVPGRRLLRRMHSEAGARTQSPQAKPQYSIRYAVSASFLASAEVCWKVVVLPWALGLRCNWDHWVIGM